MERHTTHPGRSCQRGGCRHRSTNEGGSPGEEPSGYRSRGTRRTPDGTKAMRLPKGRRATPSGRRPSRRRRSKRRKHEGGRHGQRSGSSGRTWRAGGRRKREEEEGRVDPQLGRGGNETERGCGGLAERNGHGLLPSAARSDSWKTKIRLWWPHCPSCRFTFQEVFQAEWESELGRGDTENVVQRVG